MTLNQSTRDLASGLASRIDLLGSRFRRSNHYWRRSGGKKLNLFGWLLATLVVVGFVIHGVRKSSLSLDIFDYSSILSDDDITNVEDEFSWSPPTAPEPVQLTEEKRSVFRDVLAVVQQFSPQGKLDTTKGSDCELGDIGIFDKAKFNKLTESGLSKCIQIPEKVQGALKTAHSEFKSAISDKLLPLFNNLDKPFEGEGIVMVGGGKFTLFALPAIVAIRKNSGVTLRNTIPIEIIISPEDDEDRQFCENVLPTVDSTGLTRCVFLDEIFEPETLSHIQGYQLKAIALLVSSFEKVLMLDADNYVVNTLEGYFDSEIFKQTGLVAWPDYWRRLHHPKLYDIVGVHVEKDKAIRNSIDDSSPSYIYEQMNKDNVPFHDFKNALPDAGTESGQLLVDKSKHLDTLILSLYYNYNGKSFFYPILGQGFAGEGDKDTFILASQVLHGYASYYQVKTPVSAMGHWTDSADEIRLPDDKVDTEQTKSFRGTAMLQHNYIEDSKYHSLAKEVIGDTLRERFENFCDDQKKQKPDELSDFEDERRTQCSHSQEIVTNFRKEMRSGYDIQTFMDFFTFTGVSFVHSHLPKYDPWEWSQNEDMMFDGAKARKGHQIDKETNDGVSKLKGTGHYRMYDSRIGQITGYDLELHNWDAFKTYLCDMDNGYTNFGYLSAKISATDDPKASASKMCKYIEERVKYLTETTFEV
ncbi:LAMI_0B06018g1_1 [Lachancea mirantina]|uniref:LAMI_0B06018g1_1 n=1 Tax=Lachancea mirantina TaxID=1230905 RepID=A0A1G4IW95_9SACH|nr:LAMI_0B06018g1_1 [Lachancea mirantina]